MALQGGGHLPHKSRPYEYSGQKNTRLGERIAGLLREGATLEEETSAYLRTRCPRISPALASAQAAITPVMGRAVWLCRALTRAEASAPKSI